MSIFDKLFWFRNKSNSDSLNPGRIDQSSPGFKEIVGDAFKEIVSEDYFNKRYKSLEEKDMILLDGSQKMIESFFIEKLLFPPIEEPVSHPENLDYVAINGYLEFAKIYGFGSLEAATQIAFAFSKYMIEHYQMSFYFDSSPEYQYRVFTLKKNINKLIISLYPLEYCLKVIAREKKFMEIVERIIDQESNIPGVSDMLKKYM